TRNHGEAPVRRACFAADRTGHMILQTLYQRCIERDVRFFNEFYVLDLVMDQGRCAGVVAYELANGEIHVFRAKAVLFATGGYGHLDVRHLARQVIEERIPDVTEFARVYLGVEPTREPVPIQPTAHYGMGGIPTNVLGQVVAGPEETPIEGLFAAGECACVSV